MLTIELLPAAHGDSIWIEYGSESQIHRVLIDGGPAPAYETGLRRRIEELPADQRTLELMVVTHIDTDHIDGTIILLSELATLGVRINDLWFNGWAQIEKVAPGSFAPLQGEFLDALIDVEPAIKAVRNKHFQHQAVVIPDSGPLGDPVPLAGGARLTLLGPTQTELDRLRRRWQAALRDFSPGDKAEALRRLAKREAYKVPPPPAVFSAQEIGNDRSVANGSSIYFVFEYEEVALLLAADARPPSLAAALQRLAASRSVSKLRFDAVKLPHHGSKGNISEDWLRWIDCQRWLISTNGDKYDHPDVETARLIAKTCPQPTLLCNYQAIAEQLANKGTGTWTTAFPQVEETKGPTGGLRLSWGDNPSKQRKTRRAGKPAGAPASQTGGAP